jgi:hypothetical protein
LGKTARTWIGGTSFTARVLVYSRSGSKPDSQKPNEGGISSLNLTANQKYLLPAIHN